MTTGGSPVFGIASDTIHMYFAHMGYEDGDFILRD